VQAIASCIACHLGCAWAICLGGALQGLEAAMKLVLSRKGFDSGYGGMPSPILPDGRLAPLPIPSSFDQATLADINIPDVDLGQLLSDLSNNSHTLETRIHLDPDLDRTPSTRLPGWRPALGQSGNAQSHLRAAGVGEGDVFIFFGWFRQTERVGGAWRFARTAPHLHVMFGWLEVSDVLPIVQERDRCLCQFPWVANHPHVLDPDHYIDPRNTLYLAAKASRFTPRPSHGGGRFLMYNDQLRLTKQGHSRSIWMLPHWFFPKQGKVPLSYHPRPDQWQWDVNGVTLRTAAKGQEFILDGEEYLEAENWAGTLIEEHS
jgi:Nucleotide modification associated domain 3